MLIRIFPPLNTMDMVYPDSTRIMGNKSFSGDNMCLISGFLFAGLSYCFGNVWVFSNVLIVFCFGYQCNKAESGLKTHKPCRGFVQLSLSEIR
jgi:hypothetical protein